MKKLMKRKKCKRCGKVTDMPYHTCGLTGKGILELNEKYQKAAKRKECNPDPVQLGEELAEYVHNCWVRWKQYNNSAALKDLAVEHTLTLAFERDFWRSKCLGE